MSVLVAAGENPLMKHPLALGAALCAALLFTPLVRAQTDLYVGSNTPFNTLDFTNGTNAYGYTYVGFTADASNNTLRVVNPGTLLDNSQDLVVGYDGSANRTVISNGGRVAAQAGYIGAGPGSSNNSVLVTGTNSLWANSGDLYVGLDGSSNSLVISNGATVANNFGYVGYGATSSNNSVLVTGAGSVWTNSGDLYVGYSGTSHRMVVADGGSVYNVNGFDDGASPLDSSNSVLVTDAGSAWVNSGNLTFGLAGHDNSLVVSNGGLVTVGLDAYAGAEATASNNSVHVAGTTSALRVSASLYVGNAGSGNSLVISNGGTVSAANGYIGFTNTASNNSALVTGANSLWTNSGSVVVGQYGSNNTLTVAHGGTVAASSTIIASQAGSSGTLNIGRFGTNDAAGTINTPTIAFGAGTGVINFNQSNSTTVSAAISGNGVVNQFGTGTTTLSGSNSYTGATTVSAGTLLVGGQIGLSDVSVLSGAAIGGSGTLAGSLSMAAGAEFVFSLSGALMVNAAPVTFVDFGIDDLVGLDSTVTNGAYPLIDGTAINFSNVANLGVGNAYDIGGKLAYFRADSPNLVVQVIPEPSTYALLALAVAGWGAHVWRRRKQVS